MNITTFKDLDKAAIRSIKHRISIAKEAKGMIKEAKRIKTPSIKSLVKTKKRKWRQIASKELREASKLGRRMSGSARGRAALKVASLGPKTGHLTSLAKTSAAGLGIVAGAGYIGAKSIRKAHKAAVKEIESIHSSARNIAHNKMLAAIKASGIRKRAAAKLKEIAKKPLHKPVQPGSISSPGYDYRKWR